jgi:hypothetical protein
LVVCRISSQPGFFSRPGTGDHPLRHWKAVGLHHPSTVRISNIVAVGRKIIKRVLGTVHADDLVGRRAGTAQGVPALVSRLRRSQLGVCCSRLRWSAGDNVPRKKKNRPARRQPGANLECGAIHGPDCNYFERQKLCGRIALPHLPLGMSSGQVSFELGDEGSASHPTWRGKASINAQAVPGVPAPGGEAPPTPRDRLSADGARRRID